MNQISCSRYPKSTFHIIIPNSVLYKILIYVIINVVLRFQIFVLSQDCSHKHIYVVDNFVLVSSQIVYEVGDKELSGKL